VTHPHIKDLADKTTGSLPFKLDIGACPASLRYFSSFHCCPYLNVTETS
jgi:hypothetical protein